MDEFPFPIRKIIHVDMDAFYASVEQLDNPEYRNKPIAVGGSKERGVVAAASYEARKYGVRSAMASVIAARRCPDLIFVKPRFERYKEISDKIRDVFFEFTDVSFDKEIMARKVVEVITECQHCGLDVMTFAGYFLLWVIIFAYLY